MIKKDPKSSYEQAQAAGLLKDIGMDSFSAMQFVSRDDVAQCAIDADQDLMEFINDEIQAGSFDPKPEGEPEEILDDHEVFPDYLDVQTPQAVPQPPPKKKKEPTTKPDFSKKFRYLGYAGDKYYYYPYSKKQIVCLTPTQHNIQNLLQLADLNYWRQYYGSDGEISDSKASLYASNELISRSTHQGVFDEAAMVRGCGGWMDDGRVVLHCGNSLYVDGVKTEFIDLKSKYIYVAAAKLLTPAEEALSNAEAHKLRVLCEMPSWDNKLSGSLLAGWLVVAPICAALDWRPHIWVTGQAETGKSTVMDKIIKRVLGDIALCLDGTTTEPAIRSLMKYDARPLIFDEAEKGENKSTMANVLNLVRLASSGGRVGKFGQNQFIARFMTCFSGIRPPINNFADETRISLLKLKQNRSITAREDFQELLLAIDDTLTEGFPARMLKRVLDNLPVLLQNIKTFKKAANVVIKGARASDQIAPMLAGLYFLHTTGLISQETAENWIKEQDWSFHTTVNSDNDSTKCIQHLCGYTVRYTPQTGTAVDVTIGDLIETVLRRSDKINIEWADKNLKNMCIKVAEDGLIIAHQGQNLEKVFKGTHWDIGWKGAIEAIDGAVTLNPTRFGMGNKYRATKIPLSFFE